MRIAVLSDVHGNARAFESALHRANSAGFDKLILLGDLLTYGPDTDRILDMVNEVLGHYDAHLIEGNHDRLYRDLVAGERTYYEGLPGWLREVIDFTLSMTDVSRLDALPFEPSLTVHDVFFAHANPYGVPDWRYLNGLKEQQRAASVLRDRNLSLGVFGHTHRAAFSTHSRHGSSLTLAASLRSLRHANSDLVGILNAGSVGQPRDGSSAGSIAVLSVDETGAAAEIVRIAYDTAAVKADVNELPLSEAARAQLLRYL